MTAVIANFQLNPDSLFEWVHRWREIGLVFPTLIVAVIQSRRLFRSQPEDSVFRVIRRLLPLALVAFLGAVVCGAVMYSVLRQGNSVLVNETSTAARQLCINAKELEKAPPWQVTVHDLAKVSPMSEPTRNWLRNAKIVIVPAEASLVKAPRYIAIIHFASGSEYNIHFYLHR